MIDPFSGPILAIDVGAGTQDVLIYDPAQEPENCVKLVLPSQTQLVGRRIQAATAAGRAVHLSGPLMGGGASSSAAASHLAAGLPLSATPGAARTLHNDLARVAAMGVTVRDDPPLDAVVVPTGDVDLAALETALTPFGVAIPGVIAIAVQDHGFRPGSGSNAVRFEYLQGLLAEGGDLTQMIYRQPPAAMTRMAAVHGAIPGAVLMDTGAAAVLGALGDPRIARAAAAGGAILVNVGNMHTFATLIRGRRLYGLFEHHTGGITPELIGKLVGLLQTGDLVPERFQESFNGHGAALDPAYRGIAPFSFIAVTGPRRRLAQSLGYYEAAPHGDMMLTGPWGLVEGVRLLARRD
ncbi:MAG: hypothetical protein IT337_16875 [Thermomicrobiales bacterium]|nr:hypothetical protein [Thermomicrobiales bacterium]